MCCDFNLTVQPQESLSWCSFYVTVLSKFTVITAIVSVILGRYKEEGQRIRKPGHNANGLPVTRHNAPVECMPIL